MFGLEARLQLVPTSDDLVTSARGVSHETVLRELGARAPCGAVRSMRRVVRLDFTQRGCCHSREVCSRGASNSRQESRDLRGKLRAQGLLC